MVASASTTEVKGLVVVPVFKIYNRVSFKLILGGTWPIDSQPLRRVLLRSWEKSNSKQSPKPKPLLNAKVVFKLQKPKPETYRKLMA